RLAPSPVLHPFPTRRSSDLPSPPAMIDAVRFLLPYEFSPIVLVLCVGAVVLYARGLVVLKRAGRAPTWPLVLVYFVGVVLIYVRSEEHTSEVQSRLDIVCRL